MATFSSFSRFIISQQCDGTKPGSIQRHSMADEARKKLAANKKAKAEKEKAAKKAEKEREKEELR